MMYKVLVRTEAERAAAAALREFLQGFIEYARRHDDYLEDYSDQIAAATVILREADTHDQHTADDDA